MGRERWDQRGLESERRGLNNVGNKGRKRKEQRKKKREGKICERENIGREEGKEKQRREMRDKYWEVCDWTKRRQSEEEREKEGK
jgi:hypothetical protein